MEDKHDDDDDEDEDADDEGEEEEVKEEAGALDRREVWGVKQGGGKAWREAHWVGG